MDQEEAGFRRLKMENNKKKPSGAIKAEFMSLLGFQTVFK